jgi:desampylase
MELHLSSNDQQQLLCWAEAAGARECCGLLRGRGNRVNAVELTRNVAVDPTRHFELDPAALVGVHKDIRAGGLPLLGYFHSHPNGLAEPSVIDVAQAPPDNLFWLIIAKHIVTAWQPVVTDARVTGFTRATLILEG